MIIDFVAPLKRFTEFLKGDAFATVVQYVFVETSFWQKILIQSVQNNTHGVSVKILQAQQVFSQILSSISPAPSTILQTIACKRAPIQRNTSSLYRLDTKSLQNSRNPNSLMPHQNRPQAISNRTATNQSDFSAVKKACGNK
eukprot:gb/GEZJ01003944.1/.p1 GENE.gb/GEZJ01003944.1/~~gb/GEZJ01003944.1/.p1  ORF type:complete len:142 (+),score=15.27 gb/GEZJ01003944.1/:763-1188(+)